VSAPLNLGAALRAVRWPVSILALAIGGGVAGAQAITTQLPPTFEASASSVVAGYDAEGIPTVDETGGPSVSPSAAPSQQPGGSTEGSADGDASRRVGSRYDPALAKAMVASVARLAESSEIALATAEETRIPPDLVVGHIRASFESGLAIITLTAEAKTPRDAATMANVAADHLRREVAGGALSGRKGTLYAQPLDQATVPTRPSSPSPLLNSAVGGLLGLLAGIGVISLRRRFDNRLRSCHQIETELGLPILATLPRVGRRGFRNGARRAYKRRAVSRPIRTAIAAMTPLTDPSGRRLLVTSAFQDDGKTFVSALLSLGLSQQHYHVTLLEGQLRHPPLARHFPGSSAHTVQRLLGVDDAEMVSSSQVGLRVVTSEPTEPEISRALLRSRPFARLMHLAASVSDAVVINGPGVLASGDISPLSTHADAAILVVRAGVTHVSDARRAVQVLNRLNLPVAGVIVTDAVDTSTGGPQPQPAPDHLAVALSNGQSEPLALVGRQQVDGHPMGFDDRAEVRVPRSLPPGSSTVTIPEPQYVGSSTYAGGPGSGGGEAYSSGQAYSGGRAYGAGPTYAGGAGYDSPGSGGAGYDSPGSGGAGYDGPGYGSGPYTVRPSSGMAGPATARTSTGVQPDRTESAPVPNPGEPRDDADPDDSIDPMDTMDTMDAAEETTPVRLSEPAAPSRR
jgi:Mrp family chromosome partitioning ATPase